MGRSGPDLIHGSLEHTNSTPKWHLDQFSRFGTAHSQQTDKRHYSGNTNTKLQLIHSIVMQRNNNCICKMCSHLCYQHICITAECNIVVTGTYLLMLVYCVTVVTVYIFLCRCIFYTTIGAILLPCMKSLHCLLYTLRLWLQGVICMLYESSVTWAMFYSNIAEPTPIQQYHRLQKVGDLWQNFVKSWLCNRSQLLCL